MVAFAVAEAVELDSVSHRVPRSACFKPIDFLIGEDDAELFQCSLNKAGCYDDNMLIRSAEVVYMVEADGRLRLVRATHRVNCDWFLVQRPTRAQFLECIGVTAAELARTRPKKPR